MNKMDVDYLVKVARLNTMALTLASEHISNSALCPYHELGVELSFCKNKCLNNAGGVCWRTHFTNEAQKLIDEELGRLDE